MIKLKKGYSLKILSLLIITTLLCQNAAFCVLEENPALRPPSHFSKSTEEVIRKSNSLATRGSPQAVFELQSDNKPRTRKEIADALGCSEQIIQPYLLFLENSGVLVKKGRGEKCRL